MSDCTQGMHNIPRPIDVAFSLDVRQTNMKVYDRVYDTSLRGEESETIWPTAIANFRGG
jgi:hypothetical protein